jgi:AcrR family transcriptional regulator
VKRSNIRAHILSVAGELFNRNGCHATGIDQIVAETGVAKTTLYRHFKSKEDLIVAVLDAFDEEERDALRSRAEATQGTPRDKILATFDLLGEWIKADTFFGCPFVAAAAEYPETGGVMNPVFQHAATHKRLVAAFYEDLARAAKVTNPKDVGQKLQILFEGAMATAHVSRDQKAAERAKEIAALLMMT